MRDPTNDSVVLNNSNIRQLHPKYTNWAWGGGGDDVSGVARCCARQTQWLI